MTSSRKLRQLRQTPEAMDRCQPCEREKMDPSQRHVFPDVTCTWILSVWPLQAYLRTCKQAVRAYHTRLQRHRKNLEHAVSWRWARAESTCVELTLPRFSTKSTPIQSRFFAIIPRVSVPRTQIRRPARVPEAVHLPKRRFPP